MHRQTLAFLEQVAGLVFTNPFSPQREAIDCRLLEISPGRWSSEERLAMLQRKIQAAFEQLGGNREFRVTDYPERLREMLTLAWLFLIYHRYRSQWFEHIQAQQAAGDKPVPLALAKDLLRDFAHAGFHPHEAARYLALIFQVARAFYFIQSAIGGQSPSIISLRQHLWNNIFTANPRWYFHHLSGRMEDFSTLILGETGTGKTLVANVIGRSGLIPFELDLLRFRESFTAAFQAINLAQFPTSLLESELFGHKKGAFTGAVDDHPGIFARCSQHGAVFIDEIGDLDPSTQVKLLNVLQDRVFTPLGSRQKLRFSGRVIAATHQDIHRLMAEGRFRADFYYRLCSDVIVMPTLRQRLREDPRELSHLIRQLLAKILNDYNASLAEEIEAIITASQPPDYPWLGNIRELEQCIRQICIRGTYIFPLGLENQKRAFPSDCFAAGLSLKQVIQDYCRYLYSKCGSYEAAAKAAGIDRRTLKKYLGKAVEDTTA